MASVRRTGRCDCSTRRMISSFSEPGISFPVSPIRDHAFFEQTQFKRLLGDDLLQGPRLRRRSVTSLLVAARAVSPASRRLPASRNSFDQL